MTENVTWPERERERERWKERAYAGVMSRVKASECERVTAKETER